MNQQAVREFRQVRLNAHTTNRALLGYGWSAVSTEAYAESLRPWQVLSQRDPLEPEARATAFSRDNR